MTLNTENRYFRKEMILRWLEESFIEVTLQSITLFFKRDSRSKETSFVCRISVPLLIIDKTNVSIYHGNSLSMLYLIYPCQQKNMKSLLLCKILCKIIKYKISFASMRVGISRAHL